MNNETQRRIKAYKAALPELRERVIAVALLLAMSASMLATASYAWITLSTAPEVSGMATTVAANGNLEIALVEPEGSMPEESAVGDSGAAEGRTMVDANITWGNLVNLSDPSYGLDQIALRPALLSEYNVNRYPLYGATYGKDGRVESVSDRYVYSSLKITSDGTPYFDAQNYNYGVRAISSVKVSNFTGNATFNSMSQMIDNAYTNAISMYSQMLDGTIKVDAKGTTAIAALTDLVTLFAQEKVDEMLKDKGMYNGETKSDYSGNIRHFYRMMEIVKSVLAEEGEALLLMANLQVYLKDSTLGTAYFSDLSEVMSKTTTQLADLGVKIDSLATYKTDISKLEQSLTELAPLNEACDPEDPNCPVVYWDEISTIVNRFVDVSTARLNNTLITSLGFSSLTDGTLADNGVVTIHKGVLQSLEQRIGNIMEKQNIKMTVSVNTHIMGTMKRTETVKTVTTNPYLSSSDRDYTAKLQETSGGSGDLTAKDTYGMAIDLWLRTNAANMVVTLEGTTLYTEVPATVTDKNGNTTDLYELEITIEEESDIVEVYKLTENGVDVWYYMDHSEVEAELITDENQPKPMMTQVVSGYEGENRIWEDWNSMLDAGLIEEDSTTQGSGSCFIFYADPSEQVRILDLLKAFTVAFMDQSGVELGTAALNTQEAYAINGKVTVPLEVVSGTKYTTEDGKEALGIMPLTQNEPTWVTAIIYLNGMQLENQNVLSAGEIQGRLNLQFGSSISLTNPKDEKLQMEYRTITAVATAGDQTSPSENNITFNYTGAAHAVDVTLTVDGEQPEQITGFFQRIINATQGTGGEEVKFNPQNDGTWKATFHLTTPGSYALRDLIVDGVPYSLETYPSVLIEGLSIGTVTTSLEPGIHMTAERILPVEVTAQIVTDTIMPGQVRAQFRSTDGKEANALMSYDSTRGRWVGTANITSSGVYTLEYLVMDGEFSELPEVYKTTLIVYLGMRTQIWGTQPVNEGAEAGDPYIFRGAVSIPVTAKVWDDTGAELRSLENVHLWYRAEGSYVDQGGMDAAMTWDSSQSCYAGTMVMASPGIYRFNRLQNSAGSITNGTAPVFSAISDHLPVFHKANTDDYQIAIGSNGELKVQLGYASSATVYADVVDGDGNTMLVRGSVGNEYPATIDGEQTTVNDFTFPVGAGSWTLKKLYLQNVYDKDSNKMYAVTEEEKVRENSYTMDVPNGISAYVVTSMATSLKDSSQKEFNGAEYSGVFMQEHTLSGLNLTIQDSKGNPIHHVNDDGSEEGITGVTWSIQYQDSTDMTYGGYDGASEAQRDVTLTSSDYKTFAVPEQKFRLAGEYQTKSLLVTFADGTTKTIDIRPLIKVSSQAPSVSITAITSYKNNGNGDAGSYNATSATVYYEYGTEKSCGITYYNYKNPDVTITLAGYGNASGAYLSFKESGGGKVRLYTKQDTSNEDESRVDRFEWTENGTCKRWVGYWESQTGTDGKTIAGTLTANTLVMKDSSGKEYSFTIPTITITNTN